MILVTGGMAQGKREFVERDLIGVLAGERTGGMAGGTVGGGAVIWVDGAAAEPDCFLSAPFCHNLQAFVRRIVSGEIAVDLVELAELMQKASPDRVILAGGDGAGLLPPGSGGGAGLAGKLRAGSENQIAGRPAAIQNRGRERLTACLDWNQVGLECLCFTEAPCWGAARWTGCSATRAGCRTRCG